MKLKNLCFSILTYFSAMSVLAMECEQHDIQVQQTQEIQRQKLYFAPNTGCTSETINGYTYAHYPIKLSNGKDVKITFLTEIDKSIIADDKYANILLQPKYDRLVANLSCANVKDDAITDWYMQMFGLSGNEETNKYVHVSLVTLFSNTSHLITTPILFHDSVNAFLKNIFVDSFRKIASNPVGRVLLYRILIELTRCQGDDENLTWTDYNMEEREGLRLLNVVFTQVSFSVYCSDETYQKLNVNINDYTSYCSTNLTCEYKLDVQPCDVTLFKKLVIWYHFLLNTKETIELCKVTPPNIVGKNDGSIYEKYGITTGDDLNVWWSCSLEYIRSILGECYADYGFNLSENAYRFSRNFEDYMASTNRQQYPCTIHWGDFYDNKIRPNMAGVKLAIANARQCVYNITGLDVFPGLKL